MVEDLHNVVYLTELKYYPNLPLSRDLYGLFSRLPFLLPLHAFSSSLENNPFGGRAVTAWHELQCYVFV